MECVWSIVCTVYTTECKWIQWSVVFGKVRMLLGHGNVAVHTTECCYGPQDGQMQIFISRQDGNGQG